MAVGDEWKPEEDALLLEMIPKGRRLSAAVRLGRTTGAIDSRYIQLMTGSKVRPGRSRGPLTEERKARILEGQEKAAARRAHKKM